MSNKLHAFFEKDTSIFRYNLRSISMDARNITISLLLIAMGIITHRVSDYKMVSICVLAIGIIALLAGLVSVAIGIQLTLKNKI
jgi:hypothetical protein